MDQAIFLTLALMGTLLLLLSLFGGAIKNRLYVSEPAIALAFGVLVGPQVFGLLAFGPSDDVRFWVEHVARITLAIALLDIASDLRVGYLRRNLPALLVMIGLVMPAMWAVSGLLAWATLGLPLLSALLLGAVVTPTDPVVCNSVVSGTLARKALPARVKDLVLAESGSNDALAFALVMLPVLLLTKPAPEAWQHWAVVIVLWELVVGAVFGAVAGVLAGLALRSVRKWTAAERASLLTVSITLAVGVLGTVKLIHGEGLIAVFMAGRMLNRFTGGDLQETKEHVHEALRRLFELPVFVLLGVILPWAAWAVYGWQVLVFAVAVILFRRLPVMLLAWRIIPSLANRREAAFVGWFGPIGIAAMLYAVLAEQKTGQDQIWTVASLTIALSVIIHGCTATPLTKIFSSMSSERTDSGHETCRPSS